MTQAFAFEAAVAVPRQLPPSPGCADSATGHDIARGQYVEIDPPRRVVFTFGWESENSPEPPGSTTVEITLVPDGDGTLLRLVHSGVPQEIRAGSDEGWAHYLPRLAIAAGGGEPGPDPWAEAKPDSTDERSA